MPGHVEELLRRRRGEEDSQQPRECHDGPRHPGALAVQGVVAREAVAGVENEEKGEEGGGHADELPREVRHLDVGAVDVQVHEEHVGKEEEPERRLAEHSLEHRPVPNAEDGELVELIDDE